MEMSPVLHNFFARRERLINELATTGRQLTLWYEARRHSEPTLRELASLEGMLAERRYLLERLVKLDVDMLDHLIEVRADRGSELSRQLP